MRGHVDAESLALYAEGLLSRRQSARVRSHLSGCPECAATQQQLTGVTALLGQVPGAVLPPAVAARLDLALSAEAARRAASAADAPAHGASWAADGRAPGAAPDVPAGVPGGLHGTSGSPGSRGHVRRGAPGRGHQGGTGATGTRRWALRSPAALRLVSVAAAAVVLAAGGYGLSRLTSSPSSSSASSASAPSAPQPQAGALPVFRSGFSYQPGTLGQQAATALTRYHRSEARVTPADRGIQGGPAQGSTPASGASGGHAVAGPATRQGPDSLAPAASPAEEATLRGCTATIADGRTVELVDRASYAGRPAVIIVLAAGGGKPATVWVMGPGCSAGHPDKIAEEPLGSG